MEQQAVAIDTFICELSVKPFTCLSAAMRRRVFDLLRTGGAVIYAAPDTSVADAATKMSSHNVGSILVLESGGKLVGIFTERDLLRRVVVQGLDPRKTRIGDVMTSEVVSVRADTPRAEVLQIMDTLHIRHVPVMDGDRLLGVISLRDVLRFENAEQQFEIDQLRQYIYQEPRTGATPV